MPPLTRLRPALTPVLVAALGGLAPTASYAGFGATGEAVPAASSDPADPHLAPRAVRPLARTASFSVLFEAASDTLVRSVVDPTSGDVVVRESVLTDLAGFSLAGRFAVSDRVELMATLPLWASATTRGDRGAGLGDLGLTAPIGLGRAVAGPIDLAGAVAPDWAAVMQDKGMLWAMQA